MLRNKYNERHWWFYPSLYIPFLTALAIGLSFLLFEHMAAIVILFTACLGIGFIITREYEATISAAFVDGFVLFLFAFGAAACVFFAQEVWVGFAVGIVPAHVFASLYFHKKWQTKSSVYFAEPPKEIGELTFALSNMCEGFIPLEKKVYVRAGIIFVVFIIGMALVILDTLFGPDDINVGTFLICVALLLYGVAYPRLVTFVKPNCFFVGKTGYAEFEYDTWELQAKRVAFVDFSQVAFIKHSTDEGPWTLDINLQKVSLRMYDLKSLLFEMKGHQNPRDTEENLGFRTVKRIIEAWNEYKTARYAEEFKAKGKISFPIDLHLSITFTPEGMFYELDGETEKFESDVHALVIDNGRFSLQKRDNGQVKYLHQFNYSEVANVDCFIAFFEAANG